MKQSTMPFRARGLRVFFKPTWSEVLAGICGVALWAAIIWLAYLSI